jgi:TetR/AcrR family transcriptional regulator, lmrAB and yxaGH operons repressor
MPAPLASKDEIVDRLFTVFREHGFEGASLTDLSRATGLGKSSLYHHFPEGKEQMARAVLARATDLIDSELLETARANLPLKARVSEIVTSLDKMYAGGHATCVLGMLATSGIETQTRQDLHQALAHWIEAVTVLAIDAGMPALRAKTFAEDWVAWVQGALIMQAATGQVHSFRRAMDSLLALAESNASAQ